MIDQKIHKKIIFIGFMGSGKTSIGKKLASKLNLPFYDTDEMIEQSTKKSIPIIFKEEGEEYFRLLESKLILNLKALNSCVIATGGGMPVYHNNMQKLNAIGTTIYLKHNPKSLTERIFNDPNRPIISNFGSKIKLLAYVKASLDIRDNFYKEAQIIINCKDKSVDNLIVDIEKILKEQE